MSYNHQVLNRVLAGAAVVLVLSAGSAQAQPGWVLSHQKISSTQGGGPRLDNSDWFGSGAASLGDLDGDGPSVLALAVGAWRDDDGGFDRGAVWILFLNTDGTVKSNRTQKISSTQGGGPRLDNEDLFGSSVDSLGDHDGDGVGDLAVGAQWDDDGGFNRGAVWILFLDGVQAGPVLYVDDDAPPGGDGTSWDTAYRFLQDALADACAGGIAEVRVGQGIYLPDRDEANPGGTGDRQATFQLCNGVALMGGYAGFGAKNPDLRDIALFVTTLSGDLLVNDGSDFANNDENSYNVTTGSGTDLSAVLDGFSVTAGNGNGPGGPGDNLPHWRGGGMLNLTGSPTVTGCLFIANSAGGAGGMNNAFDSSPIVTNCTFSGNKAALYAGGGMANVINSSPTITNCTFSGNTTAVDAGGGMVNAFGSSPTITNCTFDSNTAALHGGGMFNFDNGNPTITACTFDSNIAQVRGGGMYNDFSSPTVTNCTFSANTAGDNGLGGEGGGGMHNRNGSNPTVTDCTFSGNTGAGGGMLNAFSSSSIVTNCTFTGNISAADSAGGMGNIFDSSPIVTNCTFNNNTTALNGGGMFNRFDSSPIVTNCTFESNFAQVRGGGMANFNSSNPRVTNCTFSGNTAVTGGGIHTSDAFGGHSSPRVTNCILWGDSPNEIVDVAGATTTVNYSDVQGGWIGEGSNNIDADPLFVAPGIGDYHLSPGSPCADAGNNWGVPIDANDYDQDGNTAELFPVDLDGNPRFNADEADFDPGCGVPVVVDMGAYEYQFAPVEDVIFADLNADGAVGILDLLALLAGWGDPGTNCLGDLDIDGEVDIFDLLTLLAHWG